MKTIPIIVQLGTDGDFMLYMIEKKISVKSHFVRKWDTYS